MGVQRSSTTRLIAVALLSQLCVVPVVVLGAEIVASQSINSQERALLSEVAPVRRGSHVQARGLKWLSENHMKLTDDEVHERLVDMQVVQPATRRLQEERDPALPNMPKRVLYFNRHKGTSTDFAFVAQTLGVPWVLLHPRFTACTGRNRGQGMSHDQAVACWRMTGAMLCRGFDVIVVGDIIPYARMFLMECPKPIILHITNRYDEGMDKSDEAYYELMRNATENPKVFWVYNNPFEKAHAALRQVKFPPERSWLVRPVGYSDLTGIPVAEENRTKLVVVSKRHEQIKILEPALLRLSIPFVKWEGYSYYGPITISRYVGHPHIPYQVSIMAMYENMASGVAYLIPTVRFYTELQTNIMWRQEIFIHENWADLCEWWHPDFKDAIIYFDSWDELVKITTDAGFPQRSEAAKKKAVSIMEVIRAKSLADWRQIFATVKIPTHEPRPL